MLSAVARPNPSMDAEVENFLGGGDLRGIRGAEETLALTHTIERGGKRELRQETATAGIAQAQSSQALVTVSLRRDVATAFHHLQPRRLSVLILVPYHRRIGTPAKSPYLLLPSNWPTQRTSWMFPESRSPALGGVLNPASVGRKAVSLPPLLPRHLAPCGQGWMDLCSPATLVQGFDWPKRRLRSLKRTRSPIGRSQAGFVILKARTASLGCLA